MKSEITPTAPTPQEQLSTEENVYSDVYRMLFGGMIVSTTLFVVGMVLAMLHPQQVPLSSRWVRSHYHVHVVVHGLLTGNPTAYLLVATVLLILTPITRVIVSIYAFWVDHDLKFVAVTSVVLLIMVLTVILGELGLK